MNTRILRKIRNRVKLYECERNGKIVYYVRTDEKNNIVKIKEVALFDYYKKIEIVLNNYYPILKCRRRQVALKRPKKSKRIR